MPAGLGHDLDGGRERGRRASTRAAGVACRRLPGRREPTAERRVLVGRERLRQLLRDNQVSWQRTRTWKESTDPDFDAKLDRIEEATSKFPQRCFSFDQFGPLSIRPHHGGGWAPVGHPDRQPATYKRTHGIRYFHGYYSFGDDQLWGVNRLHKGADHTLSALKTIRRARPDGAPIYVIMDNLSANKTPAIRPGPPATRSSCASRRPARPGRTRSRPSSGRYACSRWPTPTTRTTPSWPAKCRNIYAGATPTPATRTYSPRNAANAPESAANDNNAGVALKQEQPDRSDPANVHGQRTSRGRPPATRASGIPRDTRRAATVGGCVCRWSRTCSIRSARRP